MATVSLYGYQPVQHGTKRLARLRLGRPIVLLPGDRFVLRQGSPVTTTGGGVVLDGRPLPRLNKARTQAWLCRLLGATMEEQLALRVARRGMSGITIPELTSETGLKAEAVHGLLTGSIPRGKIDSLAGGRLFSREALSGASAMMRLELERLFRESGGAGVKRSVLKSKLTLPGEIVEWSAHHLEQTNSLRVSGEELLPAERGAGADSLDHENLAAIEHAYRAADLQSPSPTVLAGELNIHPTEMRRLITVLLREKKLVRLGDDALCMHQDALAGLKETVRSRRGQTIDVGVFKQLTGVSRKYAIPLLEYLDSERVTRRQGDQRIVL
jgi:selenocysteine-specific elongation factor